MRKEQCSGVSADEHRAQRREAASPSCSDSEWDVTTTTGIEFVPAKTCLNITAYSRYETRGSVRVYGEDSA